jgi:hypothetical protein
MKIIIKLGSCAANRCIPTQNYKCFVAFDIAETLYLEIFFELYINWCHHIGNILIIVLYLKICDRNFK